MSTIDFQSAGSEILQELQNSQRISASVSGGAALFRVEQSSSPLHPHQFQQVAQAFGLQAVPDLAATAVTQLGPWQASIGFPDGVPVGGWANLTLFSNGAYNFSGHFHVSGAPSYNTGIAWLVKDSVGTIYQFARGGRVHGTFEAGSRDDDWNISGTNPAIAAGWDNLTRHWSYRWEARVDVNISAIVDDVKNAIGVVGAVIAIV